MALPITTGRGSIASGGDAVENQLNMLKRATVSDDDIVNSPDNQAMSAALTAALEAEATGSSEVGQRPPAITVENTRERGPFINEGEPSVLSMAERSSSQEPQRFAPLGNKYYPIKPDSKSASNGGFDERLKRAQVKLANGEYILGVTPTNLNNPAATSMLTEAGATAKYRNNPDGTRTVIREPTTVDVATQQEAANINQSDSGSIVNAVMKAGALEFNRDLNKQVPNDMYNRIGLAVTENALADLSYLEDFEGEFEIDELTGKPRSETKRISPIEQRKIEKARELEGKDITIAKGNGALGNQIHKEYQRMVPEANKTNLTRKEAETLGGAFKELYANLNPDMITRLDGAYNEVTGKKDQSTFQLSEAGRLNLIQGKERRASIFSKQPIKPFSAPQPGGTIDEGDIASFTKVVLGNLGQKESELTLKAMKNASTVAHIVDKRRGKIMMATLLGHLQAADATTWESEIHGMGETKSNEFKSKEAAEVSELQKQGYQFNSAARAWQKQGELDIPESMVYNADRVMESITMSYAQQVSAIADARNQANYLSYSMLAYNYRILPQQTYFNPVTSKITRFVTRGAKAAFVNRRGDQVDQNLRQMYAAMLVDGADGLLPSARERALQAASAELKKDGDVLRSLQNVSDADYDAVSDAIAAKIPLDSPDFPAEAMARVQSSMNLDPTLHADLIAKIKDKGQDGLMYIDGLIDYANYVDAMTDNKPFHTYFNAYIDGKTNGIASNGVQMGSEETALRTGVIRRGVDKLLDEGDVRDQLQDLAVASLNDGWPDINFDPADGATAIDHLNTVAAELYSYRQLNKDTTMTYGYGMELFSFWVNFRDAINLKLQEANPAFVESYAYIMQNKKLGFNNNVDELAKALNSKYSESLVEVMSVDAIASRSLTRASSGMFAVLNEIQVIDGPGGIGKLAFGRAVSEGAETADKTTYTIYDKSGKGKQRTVTHYKKRMTSSAPLVTAKGSEPGRHSYGGALPGPIQSLDAVTVVKTYTGKSWNDISNAGKGSPYMFTIYDAFKMDANNYDLVLGEVNKNWMKECINYSYLQAYKDSTLQLMKRYEKNKAAVLKEKGNDIISDIDGLYMKYMLEDHTGTTTEDGKKKTYSGTQLARRLGKMAPHDESSFGLQAKVWVDSMRNAMQKVGYTYDPQNPNWQPSPNITYRQYYAFVDEFYKQLDFRNQITKMIIKTNNKKQKLMQKLRSEGYKHRNRDGSYTMIPLQYFSH